MSDSNIPIPPDGVTVGVDPKSKQKPTPQGGNNSAGVNRNEPIRKLHKGGFEIKEATVSKDPISGAINPEIRQRNDGPQYRDEYEFNRGFQGQQYERGSHQTMNNNERPYRQENPRPKNTIRIDFDEWRKLDGGTDTEFSATESGKFIQDISNSIKLPIEELKYISNSEAWVCRIGKARIMLPIGLSNTSSMMYTLPTKIVDAQSYGFNGNTYTRFAMTGFSSKNKEYAHVVIFEDDVQHRRIPLSSFVKKCACPDLQSNENSRSLHQTEDTYIGASNSSYNIIDSRVRSNQNQTKEIIKRFRSECRPGAILCPGKYYAAIQISQRNEQDGYFDDFSFDDSDFNDFNSLDMGFDYNRRNESYRLAGIRYDLFEMKGAEMNPGMNPNSMAVITDIYETRGFIVDGYLKSFIAYFYDMGIRNVCLHLDISKVSQSVKDTLQKHFYVQAFNDGLRYHALTAYVHPENSFFQRIHPDYLSTSVLRNNHQNAEELLKDLPDRIETMDDKIKMADIRRKLGYVPVANAGSICLRIKPNSAYQIYREITGRMQAARKGIPYSEYENIRKRREQQYQHQRRDPIDEFFDDGRQFYEGNSGYDDMGGVGWYDNQRNYENDPMIGGNPAWQQQPYHGGPQQQYRQRRPIFSSNNYSGIQESFPGSSAISGGGYSNSPYIPV